jgi:hypothetical protein
MIWLTWRQQRVQIVGMLALAILLVIGIWAVAEVASQVQVELGVNSCVPETRAVATPDGPRFIEVANNCQDLVDEWQSRLGPFRFLFVSLYILPALVASYVGGPLFALEFERATHRLAWTQSISRVRWAASKLGVILFVAFVAALVLVAAGAPSRALMSVGSPGTVAHPFDAFDLVGPAPVAYMVFGVAVAAFIGAWSRNILAAMFAGLLIFGLARVAVHNLRPWYETPIIVPFEVTNQVPRDAWLVNVPAVDTEGRPVASERVTDLIAQYWRTPKFEAPSATNNDSTYLADHGVFRRTGYQPAERYWMFQAIESAIFFGLAALCVALTLWRVRTRDA